MKAEAHLSSSEAVKYYIRNTPDAWIRIPESKWFYKEFSDHAIFGPLGPLLRTKGKRLPPRRLITIGVDYVIVHMLPPKHLYVFELLGEYVVDLQTNKSAKGKFNVAFTPHIFK